MSLPTARHFLNSRIGFESAHGFSRSKGHGNSFGVNPNHPFDELRAVFKISIVGAGLVVFHDAVLTETDLQEETAALDPFR